MGSRTKDENTEEFDLSINELIFSLGRLKFSLRGLSSLNTQASYIVNEDVTKEPETSYSCPLESDQILQNIISEIMSKKTSKNEVSSAESNFKDNKKLSIDDLETIHLKLKDEYEKLRSHFISSVSIKCDKK